MASGSSACFSMSTDEPMPLLRKLARSSSLGAGGAERGGARQDGAAEEAAGGGGQAAAEGGGRPAGARRRDRRTQDGRGPAWRGRYVAVTRDHAHVLVTLDPRGATIGECMFWLAAHSSPRTVREAALVAL